MLKIVFLVFMCPGTLSLSTLVDADGSDPSQCCFLLCRFRVVAFYFGFFLQSFILNILISKMSMESVGWAVLFLFFKKIKQKK